uniref:MYND-type domain-containing protein n=1 Tax=Spumella elongata TaxID=89044 RepID=A0A7S3M1C6_9STRA|mmetsp:Transcript_1921/g.3151  ORF Transcript_1921/g.3151 Transcript_1921/m.3151 type:complete len:476 (+) Transcript_1921:40-1467(+)|eukprot:CAMPEP_0184992578 /NCGR_PEP_ID=MMETSP1098-20130426/41824_1 /TAXON_ID=89044 /ORGANISM="Spumella elongata, Strain CCAP 955/1" /LENGTH=475 /DNA_ID=CAMNT_0027518223 /DNA_START=40 /DNA_END=1467 /DNA_ORIENTATION=+
MDLTGRIAFYNDCCVQILNYNKVTKQSLVYGLSLPNEPLDTPHQPPFWVKTSSLQFSSTATFLKKYPTVVATQVAHYPVGFLPERAHLDLTNCEPTTQRRIESTDSLQILSSCRLIGVKPEEFQRHPTQLTRMPVPVQIWSKVGDVVEIEDLDLSTSAPVGINCFKGKNIFFRRCKFSHPSHGVCVAHKQQQGITNGALSVTFETCTFSDCAVNGLVVGTGGEALLLNCTFAGCRLGIHVVDGGKVVAKHCTFTDCRTGAQADGRGSSLDFLNSSFSRSFFDGVIASNGPNMSLVGCRVVDSRFRGVTFRGPKRTFGQITDCFVSKCDNGVVVEGGKNDVILADSVITDTKCGIFVQWDVVGYVDIKDCTCKDNNNDAESWHGERCKVTVNDVLQSSAPLSDIQIKANQRNKELTELRLCKKAGIGAIQCFHCHAEEPLEIMFMKCGRCKEACCCSKECQVSDWVNHKTKCTRRP